MNKNFKLDIYMKAPFRASEKRQLEKMHFSIVDFDKCDLELELKSNRRWIKDDLFVIFRSNFFVKGDERSTIEHLNQIYSEGVYNITGTLKAIEVL